MNYSRGVYFYVVLCLLLIGKSILKILIFTITLMEMFNLKNIIILKIYLKMKSAVKAYVPNKQNVLHF